MSASTISGPDGASIPFAGTVDPAFSAVRDAFVENFTVGSGGYPAFERGAALCVYAGGRPVVDVWGGWADRARSRPWERDTLTCVFSSTKGVVAIELLMLVERGLVDLDAPVARYWPEFAQSGKGEIPVRWLLTHQSGVSAITKRMNHGDLSDWNAMVEALAAQAPMWEPGTGHGYHGVTYGHLVGEVFRRASGTTLGQFLRSDLNPALGLDVHIGAGPELDARIADTLPAPALGPGELTFSAHFATHRLGAMSFANPPDAIDFDHCNSRQYRAAEIPMSNAMTNARSLARLYAAMANGGELDGTRILGAELVDEASRIHVDGFDLVMSLRTRFGLGFEITQPEWRFGPGMRTYGHNGAGGSLGVADPDAGIGFGYVMSQHWQGSTRNDPRWRTIFDALYGAL